MAFPQEKQSQSNPVLEMVSRCQSPAMAPGIGDALSEDTQNSLETVQLERSQDYLTTGGGQK